MNWVETAETAIRDTESKLRNLLASAGSAGDYESVLSLAAMAKAVSAISARHINQQSQTAAVTNGLAVSKKAHARSRKRPKRANGYPRFLRHGDQLVKVGWSKSSKSEYQHKAPQKAVLLFAAAIVELSKTHEVVNAQDAMPVVDSTDKTEIPDYQAYLALGWLRNNGLVVQHGRQGYTVVEPRTLTSRIEEAWKSLPTK